MPAKSRLILKNYKNSNCSLIKKIQVYTSRVKAKEAAQAVKNRFNLIDSKRVLMILAIKPTLVFKDKEQAYKILSSKMRTQHIKSGNSFQNN
jgi:hypothetical protein